MSCSKTHTVTQVRLEPAAPRSRVKHSTTEPLECETNFFLASGDLSAGYICSLDPDQNQQSIRRDLDPICLTPDSYPERFF